jgi:acetyl-CoA synthetase
MLKPAATYDDLIARFRWVVPERYNIATSCCDNWAMADPERVAVISVDAGGDVFTLSYRELQEKANRLANALAARGVQPGDRVAIMLPQGRSLPIAHMAVYKLGAVAVPLANLFGVDAIAYRLKDSGAAALVTNAAGLEKVRRLPSPARGEGALRSRADEGGSGVRAESNPSRHASHATLPLNGGGKDILIISTDGPDGAALGFDDIIAASSPEFATSDTLADDPAMMIYTSGTTGSPKGALHGHRVVLGHLPGMQMPHEFLPQEGDRLWTPADWAWAGGLLNILLPGLHFGVPVVARKFDKFDPEAALDLIARHGVRNTFVPPTALRMLRTVERPRERFRLGLRTLASGGEALGEETFAWGREALGLPINEFYGQTECNLVIASAASIGVSRPGSMGRPVPGHDVRVIREDGSFCEPDELGQVAVRRPDPVMFLTYWNNSEATEKKFIGDWMTTGDQGQVDADGYIHFVGRDDDVITSSGYRIGPGEIEDCLIQHEAVLLAAAVGKPDALRTEIVKAFVVLKPSFAESEALKKDIQAFVRTRLSAHEYPREIDFIGEMPLTTTGKVIRRLLRDRA